MTTETTVATEGGSDPAAAKIAALEARVASLEAGTRIAGEGFAGTYPRDAMVNLLRRVMADPQAWGATTGVLSLVQEAGDHKVSAAFPLMVELTATAHPEATMATAESACTYLIVRNPGNGWAASDHADVVHTGGGITIGANREGKRYSAAGVLILYNALSDDVVGGGAADVAFNAGGAVKVALRRETPGVVVQAAGHDLITVEEGGRTHLGPSPGGNLEFAVDHNTQLNGNLWLTNGHVYVNGKLAF